MHGNCPLKSYNVCCEFTIYSIVIGINSLILIANIMMFLIFQLLGFYTTPLYFTTTMC